jgi:hypothetical protein
MAMGDNTSVERTEPPAPLVALTVGGSGAGPAAVLAELESVCRRPPGEGFGVIVDARGADDVPAAGHGGRVQEVRRLRALRPVLRDRCLGLAFVTEPHELAAQGRRLRAARLLLGCPVEAFDSKPGARDWLAGRGVAVDDGGDARSDRAGE